MTRRRLPIGMQTFREVREQDCYYVDKTGYARRLLDEGKHYFLSRPRRFGKSLFLDTLKELFEGNEPLFEGLAVRDDWDWSVRHPVLRLDFGSGHYRGPDGLRLELAARLEELEEEAGIDGRPDAPAAARLHYLIKALHRRSGQPVAVLVDEYDKPILDALDLPDIAQANRDFLRGLYATVKVADADIRFTFITGVTKFSKVSLFSGLNNLKDITLDPRYSAVCGYTDADLDDVFAAELPGLDRERIREWYNGYSWLGAEKVYNPYDILLLFDERRFASHWFETGTPAFLVRTLLKRRVRTTALEDMVGSSDLLSTFDVDYMATEALLFQTGYLTITGEEDLGGKILYRLGYPNREVRQSLNERLLRALSPDPSRQGERDIRLYGLLQANDFAGIRTFFESFFAGIPYEWHTKNDIANYEGYYASVFYSHFAALGLDVAVEDSGGSGRLDMAVRFNGHVYLFEFKVLERAGEGAAMAQLKERRYADKYRALEQPIHLIAVEFSSATRNLAGFDVERA